MFLSAHTIIMLYTDLIASCNTFSSGDKRFLKILFIFESWPATTNGMVGIIGTRPVCSNPDNLPISMVRNLNV